MKGKKKLSITLLAITVILLVVYFAFVHQTVNPASTNGEATSTPDTGQIIGGVVIKNPNVIPAPQPTYNIIFPKSYSEQAKTIMTEKIKELVDSLKKNPSSYETWNDLALRYKMVDEYTQAEGIWLYLTKAEPTDSDAFINLGDLYAFYLHDNTKAEFYFLKAVEISPKWFQAYDRTTDFYVTVLKDTPKAIQFLTDSEKKTPDMKEQLDALLSNLKKSS